MRTMTLESCLNFMKDTFGEKVFEKPRFQILIAKFSDAGTLHSSVYQAPVINLDCFHNNDNMNKYPALYTNAFYHTVFSFDEIVDGYILFVLSENRYKRCKFASFLLRKEDLAYYPIHLPISNPLTLSNEIIFDIKRRYVEFLAVTKAKNTKRFADSVFNEMFLSAGNLIYEVMYADIASSNPENNIISELNDDKVIEFVHQFRLIKKYKSSKSDFYRITYRKKRTKYNDLFDCKSVDLNLYSDKYIIIKNYQSLKLLSETPFKHKFFSDTDFYNNDNGDKKLEESWFFGLFCLKTKQKNVSINLIAIHNKLYLVADGIIDVKNKVDELVGNVKRAEYFSLSNTIEQKIFQRIEDSAREKEQLEKQINDLKQKIALQENNINLCNNHLNLKSEILTQKLNVEFCEEVI